MFLVCSRIAVVVLSVAAAEIFALSWHDIRHYLPQWPRQPVPLVDEDLSRVAKRLEAVGAEQHFNRTLKGICVERQPATASHAQVRQFIVSELRTMGWRVDESAFNDTTPYGQKTFTNIIATLDPSACHRLVLSCHYDSKVLNDFVAATDSAVPCSQMIHIAKHLDPELKAQIQRKTGLTVQLIFFDGEEAFGEWSSTDSLYGSRRLADEWHRTEFTSNEENYCRAHEITPDQSYLKSRPDDLITELDRIELFVLLDLLGAKNPNFYSFFTHTKQMFDQMRSIEQRLHSLGLMEGKLQYFSGRSQFGLIEDDHVPFMKKDVPILHLIPVPFPRVWHKPSDNVANLHWPTIRNLNKIIAGFVAWYLELFSYSTMKRL